MKVDNTCEHVGVYLGTFNIRSVPWSLYQPYHSQSGLCPLPVLIEI